MIGLPGLRNRKVVAQRSVGELDAMAAAGSLVASALLAGMCIGFLPHNFYPARIFMGDIGAMLLGLLLAYGPIITQLMRSAADLAESTDYS